MEISMGPKEKEFFRMKEKYILTQPTWFLVANYVPLSGTFSKKILKFIWKILPPNSDFGTLDSRWTAGKHDCPEIWNCEVRTRKYFLFASRQIDFQNDFRPKRIKMKVCTWYQAHRGILIRLGCFLAILVQMAFLVQNLLWPAHTTTHMEITRWYQNLALPAKCGKCQQKCGKCQNLCCFSLSLSDLPFPAIFKVIITHYASNYLLPMQNTLFPPLNHLSP